MGSEKPLVSVIVTTRNNSATLDACLYSIKMQSYQPIELIVVDRDSTDDTKTIAGRYTDKLFNKGPERSAQRNFGVGQATGKYVLITDSDMELTRDVIASCVKTAENDPDIKGIIIPEESFGRGFWARCKQLERSFYVGIDWIEAARFYDRATYQKVGGFNESLISGEDWELSERFRQISKVTRIPHFIRHNEGRLQLFKTLSKKAYYAKQFTKYVEQGRAAPMVAATHNPYAIVLKRFGLFLSQPHKLFRNPLLGFGVLFMKLCEFGFGAFGFWTARNQTEEA